MDSVPIYLQSLELKNIKTFKNVDLNLEKDDGTLPQWTLILGDNSIGKSTLLQCIAWIIPNTPNPEDEDVGQKIPIEKIEPNITNEENETLVRLVRKKDPGRITANLKAKFVGGKRFNRKSDGVDERYLEPSVLIEVENDELKDYKPDLKTNDESLAAKPVVVFAYSAVRKLGSLNLDDPELEDTIDPFVTENTILYDAEQVLHTINYGYLGATGNEKKRYHRYQKKVESLLVSVLPDIRSIDDIHISSPKLIKTRIQQVEVAITTRHGNKIAFRDYSLGYKTVMSWIIDLAWRMINKYPKSRNPLEEPAIVLIDEIDLHLHPLWQRHIINDISKHFPKVQFIATAHSPLMVQSALDANYVVLKYVDDAVVAIKDPKGVEGWRVDQILTSELFDLKSARGEKYDQLEERRQELIRIPERTPVAEKELKLIDRKLNKLPTADTQQERETQDLLEEILSNLKTPTQPRK